MKKILFVVLSFAVLGMIAACGDSSSGGKKYATTFGYSGGPETFNEEYDDLFWDEKTLIVGVQYKLRAFAYDTATLEDIDDFDYSNAVWSVTPSNCATPNTGSGEIFLFTPTKATNSFKVQANNSNVRTFPMTFKVVNPA